DAARSGPRGEERVRLGEGELATARLKLARALDRTLLAAPAERTTRLCRGRLAEQTGDVARARTHYGVLAWLDPDAPAAHHLVGLAGGPPPPPAPPLPEPLGRALTALGPHVLGLAPPT